ncbi:hypothetical protein JCM19231_3134 [Vibrio ishigakensis]|uniref:Lipoprotein n=1 Tax=Vibrio ishigakensis TaxID=1481914 RepID=A0A0B8NQ55_9VIBR|nr:hypothetical protein [Vibrio ishigakensis]GAM56715.1 hypothetical protein JCM19231_3134 [Vibrio ishigakensis]
MKKLSLIALTVGATTLLAGCNPDSIEKAVKKEVKHVGQVKVATDFAIALINVDWVGETDSCYAIAESSVTGSSSSLWATRDLTNLQDRELSNSLMKSFKKIDSAEQCKDLGLKDLVQTVQVEFDDEGNVNTLYRDWGGVETKQEFSDRHQIEYKSQNYGKISVRLPEEDDSNIDDSFVVESKAPNSKQLYVTTAKVAHNQEQFSEEEQTSFSSFSQFLDKGAMPEVPAQLISQKEANDKWDISLVDGINSY